MKPISIGIGFSDSGDAYKAAKDAQDMAGKPAEFAIVFASSNYDPHQTYEVIKSVLKNANIIGCSTAGEFCNLSGKAVINSICVLAIGGKILKCSVGVGKELSKNGEKAGIEAATLAYQSLDFNPYTMFVGMMKKTPLDIVKMKIFTNIVLPDGLSSREEDFLRGIIKVTGKNYPIIGGSSGDDVKLKQTWQFANGVHTDSGVLGVISGGIKIGTAIGNNYKPISEKGAAVTKSEGRVVYKLNNQPAAKVLKELLGVDELTPDHFAEHPLGFKSLDVSNEYVIRSVMKENPDESLTFYSEVPRGAFFNLMETNKEILEEKFHETLIKAINDAGNPKEIGAVIIFNCIYKHLANQRCSCNDFDIIWKQLGKNVPVIGFNTYGEQGSTSGRIIGHHNQTSSILVIGNELVSQ